MDKRVLVSGVTGFVGPHLAKKLLNLGYEVYGLFRRKADGGKPKRLVETNLIGDVKLLEGDVTDLTSMIFALDKSQPDIIFHLAAQSFVPRSFSDTLETFRINSLGTQNLLEAIRFKDLDCKVIFAGSSEEYGLQIARAKLSSKLHSSIRLISGLFIVGILTYSFSKIIAIMILIVASCLIVQEVWVHIENSESRLRPSEQDNSNT